MGCHWNRTVQGQVRGKHLRARSSALVGELIAKNPETPETSLDPSDTGQNTQSPVKGHPQSKRVVTILSHFSFTLLPLGCISTPSTLNFSRNTLPGHLSWNCLVSAGQRGCRGSRRCLENVLRSVRTLEHLGCLWWR